MWRISKAESTRLFPKKRNENSRKLLSYRSCSKTMIHKKIKGSLAVSNYHHPHETIYAFASLEIRHTLMKLSNSESILLTRRA